MRIVIDMQGAQTGSRLRGIGRYTLSLVKAIARNRGHNEVILALNGLFPETIDSLFSEFGNLLPKENIRVWHAPSMANGVNSISQSGRVIMEKMREAFLAQLRPDVVLISSMFDEDAVVSIGQLSETAPTATILYDLIPLINPDAHFRSNKVFRDSYYRKISFLRKSRLLLAISESSRQEALTVLNFNPESVVNTLGACDEYFKVSDVAKSAKERVWKTLGISKPFVMYLGGADERKNLKRLIMAYAQLPVNTRQEHQLVFAGHMPEGNVEDYRKVARESGVREGDLIFTGYIEDSAVLTLYNTCALFVFPSLHEGLGIPPLEAMACGAPVIGANATSLPEIIGLKEALFDPKSVQGICSKMNHALIDKNFRERLRKHGLQHFRKFSWDESGKRALKALERFNPQRHSPISPLLTVEKTATFASRPLRILAIKLDHLGDFLLAVPAFAKLKAKYPSATIDLVAGSWNIPAAEELGLFENIFAYDFFKRKSSEPSSTDEHALENLLKNLGEYDFAIDFRRQPDGRYLLVRTNARVKAAYQTFDENIDESIDVLLQSHQDEPFIATPLNKTSISCQMIALVDALPGNANDFIVCPSIVKETKREPWTVAIFPKAGNDAREWGVSNFVKLVDMLLINAKISRINIYLANESEAVEFGFRVDPRLRIHMGLNFSRLSESLAKNEICIGNNSGGGHLASYLGVTSVVIFSGHELPSEWAPQFNDSYVIHRALPCSPCHIGKRSECPNGLVCLNGIAVPDVYTIALDALKKCHGNDFPELPLQKNTDAIVRELIDSISDDIKQLSDMDIISVASDISMNHAISPESFELVCIKRKVMVDHKSYLIEWDGFSGTEPEFRWTDGHTSEMRFSCPVDVSSEGELSLIFNTLGKQRIAADFNGMQICDCEKDGSGIELKMPVTNIQGGMNRLVLTLPDAKLPGNGDNRTLALAVKGIRLDWKCL